MNPVVQALKELADYLGAKLDTLAATQSKGGSIKVDFGKSSKEIEIAASQLQIVARTLSDTRGTQEVQQKLVGVATALMQVADKVGGMKPTDMSETNKLITQLNKSISNIKLEQKDVDLSRLDDVVSVLADLHLAITETNDSIYRSDERQKINTASIVEAVKNIKFSVPKEFKLDNNQVAQITHGGALGSATSGLNPSKVVITNVAMTSADTEYSHKFTAGTAGFRIKLRGQGVLLFYAWETGVTPGEGDGSAYGTVQQNHELVREMVDLGGKTIYLETGSATQVAEIEEYIV